MKHLGVNSPALVINIVHHSLGEEELFTIHAVPWLLVLECRHDLQLRATAVRKAAEDAELLAAVNLGEAHQRAPLFFHRAQRVAAAAHHEAAAVLRDGHHGDVGARGRIDLY